MPPIRVKMPEMALTAELVARCERCVPDPGPRADFTYYSEAEFTEMARTMVDEREGNAFWIFAYGSLIWNPGFNAAEHRRGTAHGWHRRFSMKMERWRGTPEEPGLMLALERGGSCDGILFRLPEEAKVAELARVLQRETDGPADHVYLRWLNVRAGGKVVPALTFWAHPKGFHLPEPPSPELTARMLARACGHIGSGAAYLYNTVVKLAEHGIYDKNLWRLQELVAREIERAC